MIGRKKQERVAVEICPGADPGACLLTEEERPVLTSRAFYAFILYAVLIWCCELFDLLCFLMGLPQVTWLSRLAALGITALIFRFLIGKIRFYRSRPDFIFWLGAFVFAVFFAWKAIRPDLSYDTMNYHLLCQIPGFADNLNYHVLPGRFQMYGFRLGDRLFYPFRLLLGLRMGTLLNALAMILLYRQLAVILTCIRDQLPEDGWKASTGGWVISTLAFLVASRFELLMQSGSYMVELLALPFFLEMLFILIRETSQENKTVGKEAILFCLCGGLLFCMKMTNIVFIAPLVLFYIWKIRKSITPTMFASCLAAGAVPVMVYLIYNWSCTGNPIYPYYNTIFHSPYFNEFDFKDLRWGPQNLKELFLWPYYMIRYPEYRLSEIFAEYNFDLTASYLALVILLVMSVRGLARRKKENGIWLLFFLYVISFAGWAATTGHIRYFMGGLLVLGLFPAILYIWSSYSGKAFWRVCGALLLIPFLGRALYGFQAVYKGREWALRANVKSEYEVNKSWVFRDQGIFPKELRETADLMLLTYGDYGSFARLMGEDVPVWNKRTIDSELYELRDGYVSRLDQMMQEGKHIYDMFPQGADVLENYLELQNENGYYVEDLFYLKSVLWGAQSFTMSRLGAARGRVNQWYTSSGEDMFTFPKAGDKAVLQAIAGNTDWWIAPAPAEIQVFASDAFSRKQAAEFTLGEEYQTVKIPLDLSGLQGEIRLEFSYGIIINPDIIPEVQ